MNDANVQIIKKLMALGLDPLRKLVITSKIIIARDFPVDPLLVVISTVPHDVQNDTGAS
jgi:hypothetical protein